MNSREFLDTLRAQLEGVLSPAEIEGHLHYYNEYISEAAASGRTEQEVLDELGNPVFIARTLMDAAESAAPESARRRTETFSRDEQEDEEASGGFFEKKMKVYHINPVIVKWVLPIVLILILFFGLSLLSSVVMLVARFFVPIMIVVIVIALFKSHGN